jgi:hypothetical protein
MSRLAIYVSNQSKCLRQMEATNSIPGMRSVSFKKYPSVYSFSEWLFIKLNMGCSSGKVSRSTSTRGGLYGCNMLNGRDVGRAPVCTLGGGGESFDGPDMCASDIEVKVSRRSFCSRFAVSVEESGDDLEERRFVRDTDHAEHRRERTYVSTRPLCPVSRNSNKADTTSNPRTSISCHIATPGLITTVRISNSEKR